MKKTVALVSGFLWLLVLTGCQEVDQPQMETLTDVQVVIIEPQPLTVLAELPGRIEAQRSAEVRARINGIVIERHFAEGSQVKAGQLLFSIEPAPFIAALSQAKAQLLKAEAALAEVQSSARRYQALLKSGAVSQQEFDSITARLKSAQADRQAAQALVETASLDLQYTQIKAPIDGHIGKALVTEGALVRQDEATPLALIQQLDTVYVDFKRSASDVLSSKNSDETLYLQLPDESQPRQGKLLFIDSRVDKNSEQVLLRGEFANPNGRLLPGMYVRIQFIKAQEEQGILLPQQALHWGSDGKPEVLLVNGDNRVEARTVQVSGLQQQQWHVRSGLQAQERVITLGSVRVGQQVNVINSLKQG